MFPRRSNWFIDFHSSENMDNTDNSIDAKLSGTFTLTSVSNTASSKSLTGGSTLFKTANMGHNPGTGSTIEVRSRENETVLEISGYMEALLSLNIPTDRLPDEAFHHYGGGYVTVKLQRDYFISRFEINDLLNGCGWKLLGYSSLPVGGAKGTIECHEIWSRSSKSKKGLSKQSSEG